jgi:DnaJ-class molecular chaperone
MTPAQITEKYLVSGERQIKEYQNRELILADKSKKPCYRCNMTGNAVFTNYEQCPECGGKGFLE